MQGISGDMGEFSKDDGKLKRNGRESQQLTYLNKSFRYHTKANFKRKNQLQRIYWTLLKVMFYEIFSW